ncbi:MAG: histidine phosphatase family protein [Chitinophagia bacterium]|nr:histidine phosphatase family protein [Chitinophagia bacterium]
MKRLLVIRHAKTHPAQPGQKDFDRMLNERGLQDAANMAERLIQRGILIDALVSSPANRALETARIFANAYHLPESDIQQLDYLYHPEPGDMFKAVMKLPDEVQTAAIFSHNPGITDFVNLLSDIRIDHLPTCGIFAVAADINHWLELKAATRYFFFFDQPKGVSDFL